jgi:hypothetical protein
MEKMNVYMANDGRVYASAIDCLKHEGVELNTSKENWNALEGLAVIIEGKVINPVTEDIITECLKYADIIRIDNENVQCDVLDVLNDIDRSTKGLDEDEGTFYYCEGLDRWICLEDARYQIKEIMKKFR